MATSPINDTVLTYAAKPAHVSRLAVVALAAAILGALTFFLVIPALVALILGIIANRRINKHPDRLAGKGFAVTAITMSICVSCLGVLAVGLMIPTAVLPRRISNRAYCAANLRGITQSLIVYSADNNDQFPVVTYAPYSPALNAPTASATAATPDDALKSYYKAPYPQAGSVTACLWILVLRNQCAPREFICKSDPTPTTTGLLQTAPAGNFYDNFQSGMQLSYSAAYPWKADGTVGKWWTNTTDSSLPLMADMAPENGTGIPPRDLTSATAPLKARNSVNHQGDGQNVAFADCHVEFARRPDVGQSDDNIWTTSGIPSTGPAQFGGIPASRSSPALTRDAAPFDIIMYPIRNATSGSM